MQCYVGEDAPHASSASSRTDPFNTLAIRPFPPRADSARWTSQERGQKSLHRLIIQFVFHPFGRAVDECTTGTTVCRTVVY